MPSQEEQFDCCQTLWKAAHQDATAMKRRKLCRKDIIIFMEVWIKITTLIIKPSLN